MAASSPASPAPIESPCVQVCMIDGISGLCVGCCRTLPEIASWSRLADDERAAIMRALPARREGAGQGPKGRFDV